MPGCSAKHSNTKGLFVGAVAVAAAAAAAVAVVEGAAGNNFDFEIDLPPS